MKEKKDAIFHKKLQQSTLYDADLKKIRSCMEKNPFGLISQVLIWNTFSEYLMSENELKHTLLFWYRLTLINILKTKYVSVESNLCLF